MSAFAHFSCSTFPPLLPSLPLSITLFLKEKLPLIPDKAFLTLQLLNTFSTSPSYSLAFFNPINYHPHPIDGVVQWTGPPQKSTLLILWQAHGLPPTLTHKCHLLSSTSSSFSQLVVASSLTLSASWWFMLAVMLASCLLFVPSAWLKANFSTDWKKLIITSLFVSKSTSTTLFFYSFFFLWHSD